ncbi:MAG: phycobiliprotein lyase, partial [Cyanobacteria bacterium J06648_11]
FSFASPTLRMRTSTVKRFGGFSTASFCTEARVEGSARAEKLTEGAISIPDYSVFGAG